MNINVDFKEFLNILKLPPSILSAISLATGLVLFLPEKELEKMHIKVINDKFGTIIGLVFVISTCLLFVMLFVYIYKKIKEKISKKKFAKNAPKALLKFDDYKTNIISKMYKEKNHTLSLSCLDGAVVELKNYGIITPVANEQYVDYFEGMSIKFFLQPWVVKIIDNNEEVREKYVKGRNN